MLPGSPATLGYVIAPDNNGRTDPEIEPYPSWEMNEVGNCSALQFVQGIAIDARGILWAVDSGRVNTLLPGKRKAAKFLLRPLSFSKSMKSSLKRIFLMFSLHQLTISWSAIQN
jgi:hypothetical protein